MWTVNKVVASSNPALVTVRKPLVRRATGSHLIKAISPGKLRALSLASAAVEIEYAAQLFELVSVGISATHVRVRVVVNRQLS